jgi:hypothetical protein
MSDLVTIDANNYAAMAQLVGMTFDANEGKSKSTLARIKVNKKPIKGKAEVNGKQVTVDVVPGGSFAIEVDNRTVYAETINLRTFMIRFMYQKYDSAKNNYIKTLMTDDINLDLKDTNGGFNCGKPSGYIKDFDALADSTKELIRSIKRTRVILGTATFVDAVDEQGNSVEAEDIPFVWEVDNKEGFKNFGDAYKRLAQQSRLGLQHNIVVTSAEREAVGNTYYVPVCSVDFDSSFDMTPETQDNFRYFKAWVENFNNWVLSEWNNKHEESISDEDKEITESIVHIDIEED